MISVCVYYKIVNLNPNNFNILYWTTRPLLIQKALCTVAYPNKALKLFRFQPEDKESRTLVCGL